MNKERNNNYIKNEDLYNEILLSKENGSLTKDALNMLITLTNQIAMLMKYKDNEDLKDVKQTALIKCLLYWRNFNPDKSKNAFAYFTQIIKNGLAEGFNKLHPKKNREGRLISLNDIMNIDRI